MSNPAKVLAFLDISGDWDPTLALVMAAALAVYLPVAQWRRRAQGPAWCGAAVNWPQARAFSGRLVAGAPLSGIGWGLAGICPGPAIANLAQPPLALPWFLAALALGLWLGPRLWRPGQHRDWPPPTTPLIVAAPPASGCHHESALLHAG